MPLLHDPILRTDFSSALVDVFLLSLVAYRPLAGAALGFSINGFTTYKDSHFILNFKGSLVEALEIHGFTVGGSGNPRVHRNSWNPS